MAAEPNTLITQILDVDKEIGELLEDSDIILDEDIKTLCYESLKDICPGGGRKIIQRAKVWKIIQSSLNSTSRTTTRCASPSSSSSMQLDTSSLTDGVFTSGSPPTPSPEVHVPTTKHSSNKVLINRPDYTIYSDADVLSGSKAGNISDVVRHRLVRGTMHNNMTASCAPFNRLPYPSEIEEMAKSLVVTHPCLRDAETGHGVLFKQLKRRLSNVQPVKNTQGPCSNKKKACQKIIDTPSSDSITISGNSDISDRPVIDKGNSPVPRTVQVERSPSVESKNNSSGDESQDPDPSIMARHFKAVQREMNKTRSNPEVINGYLNKEFPGRRSWLLTLPAEDRCQQLLDSYPCFRDHLEVIEEAHRVLQIESTGRTVFAKECAGRLLEEIEMMLYFGIHKGLNHPKGPKISSKIIYVLSNLGVIFPGKKNVKQGKGIELIHELKDYEDPSSWCSKQSGNIPIMVVDGEMVYVTVGNKMLFTSDIKSIGEATVAYIASFYLLDFDYPKSCEVGLNMLQHIIFRDQRVPRDIAITFKNILKAFNLFKASA